MGHLKIINIDSQLPLGGIDTDSEESVLNPQDAIDFPRFNFYVKFVCMKKELGLINKKYGRVTLLTESTSGWALGVCECGKKRQFKVAALRNGHTKSCGCLHDEVRRNSHYARTHGLSGKKEYAVWNSMKQRCYNPKNTAYHNYGARGIVVCDEWKNDAATFCKWARANGFVDGLEIDRKDVNGNYEPQNCHFITTKKNTQNKRTNKLNDIKAEGIRILRNEERFSIKQVASIYGVARSMVSLVANNKCW